MNVSPGEKAVFCLDLRTDASSKGGLMLRDALSANPVTIGIDQQSAVLLVERPRRQAIQEIENRFAGSAQADSPGCADNGAVHEDGVLDHGVEQRLVAD